MKIKVLSILAVVILFLFLIFLISDQNLSNKTVIVTKIIDGDTVIVQGGETIRLLGIDCDERGKECYVKAKNRIEEILLNQKVILKKESEDKDIYGRSLRYIFLNGENINSKMVKEGYCVARFPQESKYKKEIVEVEEFAISNNVGCKWSNI